MPTEFDRDGVVERDRGTEFDRDGVLESGERTYTASSTWINGESKLIHNPSNVSIDFAWIGGESFILDNLFDYSEDITTGHCYGEENPTEGETPTSWTTFSDGAAGSPVVLGDSDWGKLSLGTDLIAHGPVIDSGNTDEKTIVVTRDLYGTGKGSATLYIRGQSGTFNQDDGSPSWEEYSGPINKTWRYLQVKVEAN